MTTNSNLDLSLIAGAINGALTYGDIEGAKALALLGMELANTDGDKTDVYKRINIAAGYVGPANLSETF